MTYQLCFNFQACQAVHGAFEITTINFGSDCLFGDSCYAKSDEELCHLKEWEDGDADVEREVAANAW